MNKNIVIATTLAAVTGAGAAAGAGAIAAPASKAKCPSKEVRAVRQDVRAAVQEARQKAFSASDRVAAAKPVLDKAVAAGTIDAATEQKVLDRIEKGRPGKRPRGRRRP